MHAQRAKLAEIRIIEAIANEVQRAIRICVNEVRRAQRDNQHYRWYGKKTLSWAGQGMEVVVSFGPRRSILTHEIVAGAVELVATISVIAASAPLTILPAATSPLPFDLNDVIAAFGLHNAQAHAEAIEHHHLVNLSGIYPLAQALATINAPRKIAPICA